MELKRSGARRRVALGFAAGLAALTAAMGGMMPPVPFGAGAALAQARSGRGAPAAEEQPPTPVGEAAPPASAGGTPIEGFRQARFGMTEQALRQAIQRDFPAAAGRLSRRTHPREKTTVLSLTVEDLIPDTGPARISYILGHASRRLVQVNIVWAGDGRTEARDEAIVAAANALRDHFLAEHHRAPPDGIVANHRLAEDAILVFRAAQADGRMVLLLLSGTPAAAAAAREAERPPPLTLQLSYIRDHANPDIFRIERGRF